MLNIGHQGRDVNVRHALAIDDYRSVVRFRSI